MAPREPLQVTIYDDGVKTSDAEAWRDALIQWTGRHTVEFNGDASEPRASQHGLSASGVCDLLQTLREHKISWGKPGRHPGICPPALATAMAERLSALR